MRHLAVVLLGMAVACGGGGGSAGGGSTPTPNQNPAGHWRGTVRSTPTGQSLGAEALVTDAGEFRYVASNWVQAVGTVTVSGSSASGSGIMFGPPGFLFPGGAQTAAVSFSGGQVTAKSRFTGSYSGGGDNGTLDFTYQADFDAPPVLSSKTGTWTALPSAISTGTTTTITLTASGTFTGGDAFGTVSGSLAQPNPAQNLYRVTLAYRSNGSGTTVNYTGLGCFSGNSFTVQCSSASQEFCGVFSREKKPRPEGRGTNGKLGAIS